MAFLVLVLVMEVAVLLLSEQLQCSGLLGVLPMLLAVQNMVTADQG